MTGTRREDAEGSHAALTVLSWVRAHALARPDAIAIRAGDRTCSYARLVERTHRIANAALAVSPPYPGRTSAILAGNDLTYVELVLGLAAAGRPAILLNTRTSPVELRLACEMGAVGLLFVDAANAGTAEAASLSSDIRIVPLGPAYEEWLLRARDSRPSRRSEPSDLIAMLCTGGTTSAPKCVMWSQRSRAMLYLAMGTFFGCYTPRDRNLTVAPLYHGAGFNFCFATLMTGGTVTLMPTYQPEQLVTLIERDAISNASVVPTHLAGLLDLGTLRLRRSDLGSLKALMCNGAPLSPTKKALVEGVVGPGRVYNAYGSTEAGIISVLRPDDPPEKSGTVGRLFPGVRLRIESREGSACGDILVNSRYCFDGYWPQPQSEPWTRCHDIGVLDRDGFLQLVDRTGDMMVSGGVNIWPTEIELALMDHPGVREAAVFGVPDEYWGEAVHAAVALNAGEKATERILVEHLESLISRYKLPKRISIMPTLPKTSIGKISRQLTRAAVLERIRQNSGL